MKRLLLLVLLLPVMAYAQEPLTPFWSRHVEKGVDVIAPFTLYGGNNPQIFAMTLSPQRSWVTASEVDGSVVIETVISREGAQDAGKEEVKAAAVADLDRNGFLDFLIGTELMTSGLTSHKLYRLQREPLAGLKETRLYNRQIWAVKDTGLVTSISVADVFGNGSSAVLTSSVDESVRAYDAAGGLIMNFTLPSLLWDVESFSVHSPQASDMPNITTAYFLAAGNKGLYLLDGKGSVIWVRQGADRYLLAHVADIDGNGLPELLGYDGSLQAYDLRGNLLWSLQVQKATSIAALGNKHISGRYLLLTADHSLLVISPSGVLVRSYLLNASARCVAAVDGMEYPFIFVGTGDGVVAFTGNTQFFQSTQAQSILDLSREEYERGNFQAAANESEVASGLLLSAGDVEGSNSARELNARYLELAHADSLLKTAKKVYASGNSQEALIYAREAQSIFSRLGYDKGLNQTFDFEGGNQSAGGASTLIDSATRRKRGDEYYSMAEDQYVTLNYEESLRLAKLALAEYELAGAKDSQAITKNLISMDEFGLSIATTTSATLPGTTTTVPKASAFRTEDALTYGIMAAAALILAWSLKSRLRRR